MFFCRFESLWLDLILWAGERETAGLVFGDRVHRYLRNCVCECVPTGMGMGTRKRVM